MPKFFKWCDGTVSNVESIIEIEIFDDDEGFRINVVNFYGVYFKYSNKNYDNFKTESEAQAEIDRFLAFVEGE